MINQALSTLVTLLGTYISTSALSQNQTFASESKVYHIGCYNPQHADHFQKITKRLETIHQGFRQFLEPVKFDSQPDFQQSILQIAISFEKYLKNYYNNSGGRQHLDNYYNYLEIAKNRYKECSRKNWFSQTNCLTIWQQYKEANSRIEGINKQISLLLEKKQEIQAQLLMIFNKDHKTIQEHYLQKNNNIKDTLNHIQKNYQQNLVQIVSIETQIEVLSGQLAKLKLELQWNSEGLQAMRECRQCEQINEFLEQFEKLIPIISKQQLQRRLNRKYNTILSIRANIANYNYQVNEQYTAFVFFLENQLKSQQHGLEFLRNQIENYETGKHKCMAIKFKHYQQIESQISIIQSNLSNLSVKHSEYLQLKKRLKKQIEQEKKNVQFAQEQLKKEHQKQFCTDDQCQVQQQRQIKAKSDQIKELNIKIRSKKTLINALLTLEKTKYIELNSYLEKIDKILNCITIKQYYQQLKKQFPINFDFYDSAAFKNEITKKLNDFNP